MAKPILQKPLPLLLGGELWHYLSTPGRAKTEKGGKKRNRYTITKARDALHAKADPTHIWQSPEARP